MTKAVVLDTGLVVANHGRHCIVETPEGERLICHPRGKKSDVVVGDRVRWQPAGDEGVIEHIEPRRNLLFRQDEWKTKSFAANIDQLLIWLAVEPVFSESQLARALIAAESAGIAARIVLNKIDLPSAQAACERLKPYREMGYELIECSLRGDLPAASQQLMPLLAGRSTLVLGPSGTGKSTLINALVPNAAAQIGDISHALNSGRHTTTTTQWYWIDADRETALLDSPGFQEFGLKHLETSQLVACMPDLREYAGNCRFYNCTHLHEPACAVRAAVDAGFITESRYFIYQTLRSELASTRY